MKVDLIQRLKEIYDETRINQRNLDKLKQLRQKAMISFDEKINQLTSEHGLLERIRVANRPLRLWKHKDKRIELPINWRYFVSIPFIYGMLFPALLWHLSIEIYHQICFRLYKIPLVNPRDYFIYDRRLLSWLTFWEKANCYYCSYVNNLIRYSSEIGGRTERYWCPIKYYRRINNAHSQYDKFVDDKDPKKMRKHWEELREFADL